MSGTPSRSGTQSRSRTPSKTPKSRLPRIEEDEEDDDEVVPEPYYGDKSIFYLMFGVHRVSELSPEQLAGIDRHNKKAQEKREREARRTTQRATHRGGVRRRRKTNQTKIQKYNKSHKKHKRHNKKH